MRGGLAWWERPRPRTDRGQRRRLVSLNRRTTQLAGRRPVRADAAGKAPTVLTKRGVLRRAGTRSRDRYPTPKDFVFAADVPSGRRQATGPPTRVPSTAWQPERRRGLVRPGDSAPEVGDRQTATREAAKRQLNCAPRLLLGREVSSVMILPQVHLRKPCYDFYFL